MREIWVRIQRLPGDSLLVIHGNGGRPRWSDEHYLIADLFRAWTGQEHPARPKPAPTRESRERARKVAEIQRRFAERRRAIEAGEIR